MKKNNFAAKKFLVFAILIILSLSGSATADTLDLYLVDGGFDIDSGGSIERFIDGFNFNIPGKFRLKTVFHVDSGINEFAKLKLELKKGSQIVSTNNCYSIHAPADKTPKCDLTINIDSTIANLSGAYILRVTNNSGKRIKEFNIKKVGFNLLAPDFKSVFIEDCPNTVNLDMEGTTLSLDKGNSATRDIYNVSRIKGEILLKAKWHTATLIPNVFVKLKIELLKPDGSVAQSGNFFSAHAPTDKTPRLNIAMSYHLTQNDAELSGKWKIRVTNNSNEKIEGFNIEKGNDTNPFVSNFNSTYKADCQ